MARDGMPAPPARASAAWRRCTPWRRVCGSSRKSAP